MSPHNSGSSFVIDHPVVKSHQLEVSHSHRTLIVHLLLVLVLNQTLHQVAGVDLVVSHLLTHTHTQSWSESREEEPVVLWRNLSLRHSRGSEPGRRARRLSSAAPRSGCPEDTERHQLSCCSCTEQLTTGNSDNNVSQTLNY